MRVLYLTEEPITFSGTMVRGGQIHVRNVVEGLRGRGHDVHLIDWNNKSEREYQHSIAPRSRFVIDPLRTLRRAVSVGDAIGADVIISKTRKTYLPGVFAARRLNVPHVVHVGSSPRGTGSGFLDQIGRRSVVTRLKAPHDGYFVVCSAIADELVQLGIRRDQLFDVRNAVDTDRFNPDRIPEELDERYQEQFDTPSDRLLLGFVGGLQPYKGLDDLAAALDDVTTECHLVIAGNGPERTRLERAFGDRATFLGAVPYEQIPAFYHRIDTLVLPSHTEGLPRVVLEAQATATPLIAMRVGGLPEVVEDGETGLLVDPHSPAQLATAINELSSDAALRSQLGVNGRRAVVESYRWETMYERYERFLQEVINSEDDE
ncbi:glycosyltransferase family 4 protein [Halorubrum ezzemoulense]|uniref:glycosyltransferase family 4 protein n=1 Tax=Halorubrum ezzemoulense TaxID=337243 RepID=UPI00232CAEDC|nr:glycosyltransferase family 4 protein [Halorubrum ezzemoulense]MDB2276451.1 glycosyltransferase family 4 protein [Halorubrum ezzemoulense]